MLTSLLRTVYKDIEGKAIFYLAKALLTKGEYLCIVSMKRGSIQAEISSLGYVSYHPLMQPAVELIGDIHDKVGQHILLRFGLPPEGSRPKEVRFIVLPEVFNKLGFVATTKLLKHCKADRAVGPVTVVNFDSIGRRK